MSETVSQCQQKPSVYLSSSCSEMDFNLERKTSAKDIYNLHITFLTLPNTTRRCSDLDVFYGSEKAK